ncbi:hypothetical protein Clacol_002167 [Clathrus columnatus]|uniref:Uncharacterized protein n=1 Tax=Clathrus columnatus TaxID=1419009 RepID=A0AAV5A7S7_9AGAM|nr:hypothetical protein Clacol_002167 [Clathrus columnatus]
MAIKSDEPYGEVHITSTNLSTPIMLPRDSTTLGLPLFLEDTTGYPLGPTDFSDIYDRPPFIHVRNRVDLILKRIRIDIFELDIGSGRQSRNGISLHLGPEIAGNVVFLNGVRKYVENWLYENGSGRLVINCSPEALADVRRVREFQASDQNFYQWSFRTSGHEWTCTNVKSKQIVAHYDLKSVFEPIYSTSGNVLMVYELWTDLTMGNSFDVA